MNVPQAIASLLYDHDVVIVPALGAFVRHDESAQVNVITNEFQRPASSLSFDPSQREENALVMDYLMLHNSINDEEARQQIASFVADCYTKMREGETVTLEGLGTLSFNSFQELVFEPDASADFNAEAFGLEDLEAQPVYRAEPLPVEIEEPARVTTDLKKVSPEVTIEINDPKRPNLRWLWLLLLLLVAGGVALWYFKFRPIEPAPPTPPTPQNTIVDTVKAMDSLEIPEPVEIPVDTMTIAVDSSEIKDVVVEPEIVVEPTAPTEVVKPKPESKAFIVGGCFSVEENAMNMAKEAFAQGCQEAFVMKRGSKFFVCYGQYPNSAEAKAVLPNILEKHNDKAWILIK